MSTENLKSVLEFVQQIASLTKSAHPEELYDKADFQAKFRVGKGRVDRIAQAIQKRKFDHASNGHSVVAPLRIWYEAMKITK